MKINQTRRLSFVWIIIIALSTLFVLSGVSLAEDPTIAAGKGHTLAIKPDRTLLAWGDDTYGQLGDGKSGTGAQRLTPEQIRTDINGNPFAGLILVAAGTSHSLAIKLDGTLWAWGDDTYGQLGDGKSGAGVQSSSPEQISIDINGNPFADLLFVTAGVGHSLALKKDGTLWAWGYNSNGQLGDGTTADSHAPQQIGTDTDWISIAGGDYHSLGLKSDGTLWAWGDDTYGQLGDGNSGAGTQSSSPIQIAAGQKWLFISAGTSHSLAIGSDGSLWAWGDNTYGELGDGTTTARTIPKRIGMNKNWVLVIAGNGSSFGLRSDGTLWAWGNNNIGQLGNGATTNKLSPVQIGQSKQWVSISSREGHSIGLQSDETYGTYWTWGDNTYGELGDGTTTNENSPEKIFPLWASVAGGYQHSIGLKPDGTIWAWGHNNVGQLGDGTTVDKTSPVRVGSSKDWVSISTKYSHTLAIQAIQSQGTSSSSVTIGTFLLWAWGWDATGQLGNNTTTDSHAPSQIGTSKIWASVAAGYRHSLGLKSDGTLWVWGNNSNGQLGDGTIADSHVPEQIGTETDWTSIVAGANYSLALQKDGTLWAWGNNSNGQLGDGTTTDSHVPEQIGTDTDWTSIAAGANHSLAIKSGGTLWVWGQNNYGQLGDTSTADSHVPEQIGTDSNWVSVTGGEYHSLGLKSDGTLWAWGSNSNGQLGDGTTNDSHVPEQIGTDTSWASIAAGYLHTLAVKSDGTLWVWGQNNYGQLGDGTTADKLSPVERRPLMTLPTNSDVYDSCSLINKYQPVFKWTPGETFNGFSIVFSTSNTDFKTKGVMITSSRLEGTVFSFTPSAGVWNTLLSESWNGGTIRSIYWRVVGIRTDSSTAETQVGSFQVGPAQAVTIVSPNDGDKISSGTPFVFNTNCNTSFMLEVSTSNLFGSSVTESFSYSVKDPNATQTLSETLTSDQWNSVVSLVGSGTGYFRIRAKDAIARETISSVNSFTITTP